LAIILLVILSAFSFALTTIPVNASATTHFVGGSGPGNYTRIQDAIDAATPGSTVFVYDGSYYEGVIIDKPLSLVGEMKETAIINGSASDPAVLVTSDWVNITDLTMTGSRPGASLELRSVSNCNISNNTASSSESEGILLSWSDQNIIANNTVSLNGRQGILVSSSHNNSIINNTVTYNGGGITFRSSNHNAVSNNTISSDNQLGIHVLSPSNNNTISRNTMEGGGILLSGNSPEQLTSNEIDALNTVNNKPIFFWKNSVGGTVPLGAGQVILVNCTGVVIENQEISNSSGAIAIQFSTNSIVANNTLTSNIEGISVDYSDGTIIVNNNVSSNGWTGIHLSHSSNTSLSNNTVLSNNDGIIFWWSNIGVLENNTVSRNTYRGIFLDSSETILMYNNGMSENGISLGGAQLEHWNSHTIDTSNTVNGKPIQYLKNVVGGTVPPGAGQVILANCIGIVVENQNVSNGSAGITLAFSSDNTIANNTASSNVRGGILLYNSGRNQVTNNTAHSNGGPGVRLLLSDNTAVIGNNVSKNHGLGIHLTRSGYSTITGNTAFSNGGTGITATDSSHSTVSNNTIYESHSQGISIRYSEDVTVVNNTLFPANYYGIHLDTSKSVTVADNSMERTGIYISGYTVSQWNTHTIDTLNTVNGKPVHYWKNATGGSIPSGAGEVILANCTGVVVEDQNVSDGSVGILLGYSSNNIVNNVTSSNNREGIYLSESKDNIISNNTVSRNRNNGIHLTESSDGNLLENNTVSNDRNESILLDYSRYNILSNNRIVENGIFIYADSIEHWNTHTIGTSNTVNGKPVQYWKNVVGGRVPPGAGQVILANCTDVVVDNQSVTNTFAGIMVGFSFRNVIVNNTAANNEYGFYVEYSFENEIYHNSFIDNEAQALDYDGINSWDNDYPSGGNYWSDYTGTDEKNGPIQNIPGPDGIGDIAFEVEDQLGLDRYPLMSPPVSRPPPLPPTNLTTEVLGVDDILLNWTAPDYPLIDHYLIYRSPDQREFDFSSPIYDTSSDLLPLRTNWTDVGSAGSGSATEYYYVVRVVGTDGQKSTTSNTAGKWTRPFGKGISAFSLPLQPFDDRNLSWFASAIPNVDFIRWVNPSGHWITHYSSMGPGFNDTPVMMGTGFEVSLSSPTNFTFCGYPASMIRFHEGFGDPITFRKSLSVGVDGANVNLSWEAVAGAIEYSVFRNEHRNGLHNPSLPPLANVTSTNWKDIGAIGNYGSELYYMVIPVDFVGELGSSSYSVGVITVEYESGSDTFALPLKPVGTHFLDWYCDHVPSIVGMAYLKSEMWIFHANEMPVGVYDVEVLQGEGFQISFTGPTTRFTFVGY
jgi:parallel beta-helix repeat protein